METKPSPPSSIDAWFLLLQQLPPAPCEVRGVGFGVDLQMLSGKILDTIPSVSLTFGSVTMSRCPSGKQHLPEI